LPVIGVTLTGPSEILSKRAAEPDQGTMVHRS
jgi:hypothetical protein